MNPKDRPTLIIESIVALIGRESCESVGLGLEPDPLIGAASLRQSLSSDEQPFLRTQPSIVVMEVIKTTARVWVGPRSVLYGQTPLPIHDTP